MRRHDDVVREDGTGTTAEGVTAPDRSRAEPEAVKTFRRAVFFIAGFDPNGAPYLYWLFRKELGKHCAVTGDTARLTRLTTDEDGLPGWHIDASEVGRPVSVDYTIFSPQDAVRQHYYVRTVFGLIAGYVIALVGLFRSGAYRRLGRLPLRPLLLLHYILLSIPGFLWAGAELAYWPLALVLPGDAHGAIWLGARLAVALAALQALLLAERAIWLYFFISAARLAVLQARGKAPIMDQLVADWAATVIARQARRHYDEVLIVGHSIGTIQAVQMVERLLADPAFAGTNKLSLLTVGSADMVLSFQDTAREYRRALATVATARDLVWVEYWAEVDFICRGGADPVLAAGIDLGGRLQTGPAMRAIDLASMYATGRRIGSIFDLVKLHFLYLSSGNRAGGFSYFRMICGAGRLR